VSNFSVILWQQVDFEEMRMMSILYETNMLSSIFTVLTHRTNSLWVHDTLSWFWGNQYWFLLLTTAWLTEKQQILILWFLGLNSWWKFFKFLLYFIHNSIMFFRYVSYHKLANFNLNICYVLFNFYYADWIDIQNLVLYSTWQTEYRRSLHNFDLSNLLKPNCGKYLLQIRKNIYLSLT
jgi:hypothetical protein